MGYEIVRGPFLLMETVAMLHKYVNGLSFQSAISRQRFFMSTQDYLAQSENMRRLQQMMEHICKDLDRNSPRFRHYFASAGEDPESVCLAQLMIHPFCTLREPELRKNASEICRIWQDLQQRGYWLTSVRNQRTDFPVIACAVSQINGEYRASIGARPSRAMLIRGEKEDGFAACVAENAPTEGNMRGSAAYRSHLIRVLVERSMNQLGGM